VVWTAGVVVNVWPTALHSSVPGFVFQTQRSVPLPAGSVLVLAQLTGLPASERISSIVSSRGLTLKLEDVVAVPFVAEVVSWRPAES
jgi:hypothetical protein